MTIMTPSFPYVVGWSITNKCNLKCVHCNMDSGHQWDDELTYEECCNVIDQLKEGKTKTILFTGGEPLTRNDFFQICNYALQNGIEVGLTTNATCITESIIREEFWKFSSIRISIDSITANIHDGFRGREGVFDHAINVIGLLKNYGYVVSISTCISKINISELEDMADFFAMIGVSHWCLPLLSIDGRGRELSSQILQGKEIMDFIIRIRAIAKKYPSIKIGIDLPYVVTLPPDNNEIHPHGGICVAAITELTIFANGDVSPCFAMITSAGNIRNKALKDIWNNSKLFCDFRNKSILQGKCKSCGFLMECGGGCRANAFIKDGNYLGEDWLCWI